jgi:hypothetical protein
VIAFLDTEFTELVVRPRLLSVGLVAGSTDHSGTDFYSEVTDPERIQAAGRYAVGAVLPQFGKVAHAACTYAELGTRLATFLGDLVGTLRPAEVLEIAYGYDLDWELIDLAVCDAGAANWASTRCRIRPRNVYQISGFGTAHLAAETYFRGQKSAPFARHHALCDARALRIAYEAALQEHREPVPAIKQLEASARRLAPA